MVLGTVNVRKDQTMTSRIDHIHGEDVMEENIGYKIKPIWKNWKFVGYV